MTLLEKAVYLIAGLLLSMVIGFAVAFWWTSREPSRPAVVRADATFLWAPAVGLPAPAPRQLAELLGGEPTHSLPTQQY
jgi:hypothetical protein